MVLEDRPQPVQQDRGQEEGADIPQQHDDIGGAEALEHEDLKKALLQKLAHCQGL
jgi:hypothetical protein